MQKRLIQTKQKKWKEEDGYISERERKREKARLDSGERLSQRRKEKKNAILALNIINFVGPHCNKATK